MVEETIVTLWFPFLFTMDPILAQPQDPSFMRRHRASRVLSLQRSSFTVALFGKIQSGCRVKEKLFMLIFFSLHLGHFRLHFSSQPMLSFKGWFFFSSSLKILLLVDIFSVFPHPDEVLAPNVEAARVSLFLTITDLFYLGIQFIRGSLHLLFFANATQNMILIFLRLLLLPLV